MNMSMFKTKYNIKKLSFKESIKKAIERLSYDEAWAAWYYDEVMLNYHIIMKNKKNNSLN